MSRAGLGRLLCLGLIWGSSFLWIKLALRGLGPGQIVLVRLFLGALVLGGAALARGQRLPRATGLWRHLFTAALFANLIPYLLFAYAEQHVGSAVAGILNATTPLWTVLIATTVGLEASPGVRKLAGLGLGFGGAVLTFSPWNLGSQVMSWGGVACLVAAASYGVSYVYMARNLAGRGFPLLALSAAQLLAGALLSVAAVPVLGWQAPVLRADALSAVLILGVVGTGVAYVINYHLISDDGPSSASVVTYLLPVVAVVLGALTLAESIPLNAVAGMLVILAGLGLTRGRGSVPETASFDETAGASRTKGL
ncbi:MAG: DMT family transporter [Acidimicrobiia bacterium]